MEVYTGHGDDFGSIVGNTVGIIPGHAMLQVVAGLAVQRGITVRVTVGVTLRTESIVDILGYCLVAVLIQVIDQLAHILGIVGCQYTGGYSGRDYANGIDQQQGQHHQGSNTAQKQAAAQVLGKAPYDADENLPAMHNGSGSVLDCHSGIGGKVIGFHAELPDLACT